MNVWLDDDGNLDSFYGVADDMMGDVLSLVREAKQCLCLNLFHAALNIVLTLPDICARVMFKDGSLRSVGERYVSWCDSQIDDECSLIPEDSPYSIGQLLYALRCSLLYAGNSDIVRFYGKDGKDLVVPKVGLKIWSRVDSGCSTSAFVKTDDLYYVRLDVRSICVVICDTVTAYVSCLPACDFYDYASPIIIEDECLRDMALGKKLYSDAIGRFPDEVMHSMLYSLLFDEYNALIKKFGSDFLRSHDGVCGGLTVLDGFLQEEFKHRLNCGMI